MTLHSCVGEYAGLGLVRGAELKAFATGQRHLSGPVDLLRVLLRIRASRPWLRYTGRRRGSMSGGSYGQADLNRCEVKVDGAWIVVSLIEAQGTHAKAEKRCPACHGRVSVAGSYTAVVKRTLTHRRVHDGCPMLPRYFCGTASSHPEALK